jgi:putative ABC transport system permease protein
VNESIVMSTWSERLAYSMLKALTPLASALALAGLFSVLAYNVECRRKEFGVRLALGASPMKLIRLVLKRGLVTAGAGVFAGSICSVGLTRFIRSLLFETAPYDPLVYLVVASGLLIAAAVACWLPARRAARVDPVISLRAE